MSTSVLFGAGAPPETAELRLAVISSQDHIKTAPEIISAVVNAKPVTALGGRAKLPEPVEVSLEVPGDGTLFLPEGYIWEVRLKAPGYWSPPAYAESGRDEEAGLKLFPTGRLHGRLTTDERAELPTFLEARFRASEAETTPLEGSVTCPIDDGHFPLGGSKGGRYWNCDIPAGTFDIRLRATRFISHFLWDTAVIAGKTRDFPPMVLKPGSSIIGQVETGDGSPLDHDACRISLKPMTTQILDPTPDDREAQVTRTAKVSPRGFFQLEGIAAASYTLTVKHRGFAPAQVKSLQVKPREEVELAQPVVLERALTLEVVVDPISDIHGKPWTIEISHFDTLTGGPAYVGRTKDDGLWRQPGVAPGDYNLAVLDSRGSRMKFEDFTLTPQSTHLHVELPLVEVEGRMTLGDEPLAHARIVFGGFSRPVSIALETNDDGVFSGLLPRDGKWNVGLKSPDPPIHRNLRGFEVERSDDGSPTQVDIELPDTVLEGKVVDHNGNPVERAVIILAPYTSGEFISPFFSENDGSFRGRGFEPGTFRVEATKVDGKIHLKSEATDILLEEGSFYQHVRLVLHPSATIRGTVASPTGPILGAQVMAQPLGDPIEGLAIANARTNVNGEFELNVRSLPTQIQFKVLAPGFTLRNFRTIAHADKMIHISVDQTGGTLYLDTGDNAPKSFYSNTPDLRVYYDDFDYSSSELQRWAFINGQTTRLTPQKVPLMPPGYYTVCPTSVIASMKKSGQPLDTASSCETGFLAPGSELTLAVRWPTDTTPSDP